MLCQDASILGWCYGCAAAMHTFYAHLFFTRSPYGRYTLGRATAFFLLQVHDPWSTALPSRKSLFTHFLFLLQGLLCAAQGIVDPFLPFKELPHSLKNFATLGRPARVELTTSRARCVRCPSLWIGID